MTLLANVGTLHGTKQTTSLLNKLLNRFEKENIQFAGHTYTKNGGGI